MEEDKLRQILYSLLDYLEIIGVNSEIIKKALISNHKDFEDSIQIYAASTVKNIDGIVTRNIKDFKNAGIAVFTPDELIRYI